ncbi:MAG: hypothetical protein ACI4QA_05345 [Candidatus Spyradosoma sp.]
MKTRKFFQENALAAALAFAACAGFAGCCAECGNAAADDDAAERAVCGAYGEWISPVPAEALEVFARAAAGTAYAGRVPVKVSTQVVAGTNYRFAFADGGILTVFEPLPGRGSPEISGE